MHVKYGPFVEVVSGKAPGGDEAGEAWAAILGIAVKGFVPDWIGLGDAAGPVRNQQMARYLVTYGPGMVLLFPGGKGTASMRKIAKHFKLPTKSWPEE